VEPAAAMLEAAMAKIEAHVLRAYDAVQLTTALALDHDLQSNGEPPIVFISADENLNAIASSEGLAVENPNRHP
jgi:hypothetical protein